MSVLYIEWCKIGIKQLDCILPHTRHPLIQQLDCILSHTRHPLIQPHVCFTSSVMMAFAPGAPSLSPGAQCAPLPQRPALLTPLGSSLPPSFLWTSELCHFYCGAAAYIQTIALAFEHKTEPIFTWHFSRHTGLTQTHTHTN